MPHAVLRGGLPLSRVWEQIEPVQEVSGSDVLQLEGAFLRHDRAQLLLMGLVIEQGVRQHFFISIAEKGDRISVSCQKQLSLEKTPGVKKLVSRVVQYLIEEGATVEKSNLEGF